MYISINIDEKSTPAQLLALSDFTKALATIPEVQGVPDGEQVVSVKSTKTKTSTKILKEPKPEAVAEPEPEAIAEPEVIAEPEAVAEAPTYDREYTEPELQKTAGIVARTKGPELVKAKISEIGGTRIADLTQEQRNQLGTYLEGLLK